MKFETNPYALATALKTAAQTAAKKSSVPAMGCTRIRAVGHNDVRIDATDLQTYLSAVIAADVREEGVALAPAAALAKTAERMPRTNEDGDAALVEVIDGAAKTGGVLYGVTMRAAGSEAQMAGFPPEDYPALPEPDGDAPRVGVEANALREAIAAVGLAADPDSTLQSLQGIALETGRTATVAKLVATDGKRLHSADIVSDGYPGDGPRTAIVPIRAAKALAKLLKEHPGRATLAVCGGWLHVALEDGTAWGCRLVEAIYPEWRKVLPEHDGPTVEVPVGALDAAIARAQSAAEDEHAETWFRMDNDCIGIHSRNASAATMDAVSVEGPPDDLDWMRFDAAYMRDALAAVGGPRARVSRSGEYAPAVLRNADGRRTAVVMPLRFEKGGAE